MTGDLDQAKAWQRYRNRQSNGFGKNFEKSVLMACDYYRDNNLADISKVDEPFRVIRLTGNGGLLDSLPRKQILTLRELWLVASRYVLSASIHLRIGYKSL